MLSRAEPACFVIADISGYTAYLAGVELDHAQDIIADLMDTVVRHLRPTFKLAKFEGDAAFLFAVGETFDGSLLQDMIETTYFLFRKRLRNIEQATSCECKACHGLQQLDLKFVVHHGEFIRQRLSGREELAGRDVILVHRLLKSEGALRVARRAEGGQRTGVRKDVELFGVRGGTDAIQVVGRSGEARACPGSPAAEATHRNRRQLAIGRSGQRHLLL